MRDEHEGGLTAFELEELCAAYWSYYRARRAADEGTAETLWWAWVRVDAIGLGRVGTESIEPVRVLTALAEHAGDDRAALAFLGAGPVEDYLKSNRFDAAVLERAVSASGRLRQAIRYVR